ncbi:hypothetical protein HAX54_045970 [Datura stramonium]|uniref:Uncharacterized protein n=1 Tax=Datura stramonium TaxID=4076 RepID=A0ABS8WIE7_DATST|nr:hypothetical protein [Datura stramonium]
MKKPELCPYSLMKSFSGNMIDEELAVKELAGPAKHQRITGGYLRTAAELSMRSRELGVADIQLAIERKITNLDPRTANATRGQGTGLEQILARTNAPSAFRRTRLVNSR